MGWIRLLERAPRKHLHLLSFVAGVLVASGAAALFLPGPSAAGQVSATGVKISYVDVMEVAEQSQSIQAGIKIAEAQMRVKDDELEVLVRAYQQEKAQFERQKSALSTDEVHRQEASLDAKEDRMIAIQREIKRMVDTFGNTVMGPSVDRIIATIRRVAKQRGDDLVLRSETVIYGADHLDLTPLVVLELDKAVPALSSPSLPPPQP